MDESFVQFIDLGGSASAKTRVWSVAPAGNEWASNLGLVKWFGRWRCYSFFPRADTVFERKCLRDIADFCEEQTKAHRDKKRAS